MSTQERYQIPIDGLEWIVPETFKPTIGVIGFADIDSEAMSADDERVALEFDKRRKTVSV